MDNEQQINKLINNSEAFIKICMTIIIHSFLKDKKMRTLLASGIGFYSLIKVFKSDDDFKTSLDSSKNNEDILRAFSNFDFATAKSVFSQLIVVFYMFKLIE